VDDYDEGVHVAVNRMNLPITTSVDRWQSLPERESSSPEWRLKPLTLPTMYDLPSEDPEEPGLPDTFHGLQPQLLDETLSDETLCLSQYSADQVYSAFDLNLYYDSAQTAWYKRPDWFLCIGVQRLYKGLVKRSSYVMWEEKIAPTIVIEFLSPGTEAEDLGRFTSKTQRSKLGKPPAKFVVYEEILKIPNYIVFDEETQRLRFFRLVNDRYEEQTIEPENPRLWIPELQVGLGLTACTVRGFEGFWLRWCDAEGNFFPTPSERYQAEASLAQAEAEAAQAKTALAQAKAEAAEAEVISERQAKEAAIAELTQAQEQQQQAILNFLSLGLSPEQISIALGVDHARVEAIRNQL
jgi:Uma2 family endonuclease